MVSKTNYSFMKVKVLQNAPFVINIFIMSIFEWLFYTRGGGGGGGGGGGRELSIFPYTQALTIRKDPKMQRNTPKYSPIL